VGARRQPIFRRDFHVAEAVAEAVAERDAPVAEPVRAVDDRLRHPRDADRVSREQEAVPEAPDPPEPDEVLLNLIDRRRNALSGGRRVERHERGAHMDRVGHRAVHGPVQRVPHGVPGRGAVPRGTGWIRSATVLAVRDVLIEMRERRIELGEERAVRGVGGGGVREPRAGPQVRSGGRERQVGACRDADDRDHHADRESVGEAQLCRDRGGAALLAHAQQAPAQVRYEPGDTGRGANILLEPRDDRDGRAAHRVASERQPEAQPGPAHELRVPRDNARIERHTEHAMPGDIGPLDGLPGEHGPARQGHGHARQGGAYERHSDPECSH